MAEQQKVFKIGIAMAGAVSAGAYTAGVIDYLLETLSKWEGAKERNKQLGKDHPEYDHSVPMHDVVIEVMGGSSAGGMTAAITALGLFEGLRPINDDNPNKDQNKLYEAWVNLNDKGDGKMSTLLQMLQTEDIEEHGGVISLLNSKPIDQIADRAAELKRITKLPDYIAPDLEVILTITSLRGIPLAVNFFDEVKKQRAFSEPPKPAHRMYLHKGIAHFKVNTTGAEHHSHTLPFNPEQEIDRATLLQCAKATGAFPLGLAPRHLTNTQTPYIRAMVDRMFSPKRHEEGELPTQGLRIQIEEDTFDFYAVDGGTVNNEPFGEVIRALEEKSQNDPGQNYAVLMIDPFPNFEGETQQDREETPKLIELVPKVLGAIRGQAMMKESDLVGGLSSDHTLRMIFPSRREGDQKDPYPISCGSLDGFGGFFSRGFREHDFELGRRNCQSFLRNYFCIPTSKAAEQDSVFRDWDASDERHKRFYSESVDGYPIVPDMNFDQ
ncbi:patatin-like phospholipase family protein, partial [Phaeodactylibacter sp.]|uniref:patatin-like phospholipase family protein n=1 Tax=Phaeodactylibacter sp. TaxID=1940289 RepID=UPI0025EED71C